MISPVSSTAPMRSASPSNAIPSSAPVRRTSSWRSSQVLGHRGIGMMVGEGAVRLAEERRDLGTQRLERGDGDDAADAVAAVGHDLAPAAPAGAG